MHLKDLVLKYAPIVVQNMGISVYNSFLYWQRHRGQYQAYRDYYRQYETASGAAVDREAERRLTEFLQAATTKSAWYQPYRGKALSEFPILEKTELLANMDTIRSIEEKEGIVSLTGGTTGASMKVIYAHQDMQERFALKDHFRARYGYSLGKKVAWFSGKSLVRPKDLISGKVYRDDYINKIRFFSTFHIGQQNFDAYWRALCHYQPDYMVGFPSSVYELCTMALERKLSYPGKMTTFFPTAETVLPEYRDAISKMFGCQVVDQYSASEGAPFILECPSGSLHIHPLTGIFEVVDENLQPSREGEILVTSFTSSGTPLIRYRIGDRIKLASDSYRCACGSGFPVVEHIDGRTSDFIWSPEYGKVGLGNISNCTKDVQGIICFQATQTQPDAVGVAVVASDLFTPVEQEKFLDAMTLRLGSVVKIALDVVDELPKEKSGKFRIVKNQLTADEMRPWS